MSDTKSDQSNWPEGVAPISYGGMARLGVGPNGRLYWGGKPVEVQQHIRFSIVQTIVALLVATATIIGGIGTGINEGFDFGYKVHLWSDGCRP